MSNSERKKDEIRFETFVLDHEALLTDIKKITELNTKLENLNAGDIVIITPVEQCLENRDRHLREAKFYFVNNQNGQSEKYLSELNKAPNGWPIIPVNIGKSLEGKFKGDFIQDYMKKYLKLFHDYLNCFKGIELDIESKLIPADFMAKYSGANLNNNGLRVFYFFENPVQSSDNKDFDGNLFVYVNKSKSGNSELDDNFLSLSKGLGNLDIEMDDSLNTSADTSELNMSDMDKPASAKSLSFESITERDLEMEEYAKQFKSIYENQFKDYLRQLKKNDALSVTSLPTGEYNKETFEMDMMNSTTLSFQFDSLELDDNGQIGAVIMTSYDRMHTYYFDPFVCDKYGPFFTTTLYTCMYNVGRSHSVDQQFFLDLPLELYNLLEKDE